MGRYSRFPFLLVLPKLRKNEKEGEEPTAGSARSSAEVVPKGYAEVALGLVQITCGVAR